MTYTANTWTDGVSAANAARLTNMENGITAANDAVAGTTTGEPGKLLLLDDASRATAADAIDDTQLASLGQVKALVASGGTTIRQVVKVNLATQPTVSSDTVFVDIPDLILTGLQTGDKVAARLKLKYHAATGGSAGGLQVRFKTNATGVTNKLTNPSFETDLTGWTYSSLVTPTRDTALGGQDGSANLKVVVTGAATSQQVNSEWVPVTPGEVSSGGIYVRRVSATARVCRTDMEYKNAAGDLLTASATSGLAVTPGTGSWTQAIVDSAHGSASTAPATATHRRIRARILNVVAGDEFHFDAAQVEQTATLPAYGSNGGGGTVALEIDGEWYGLANAASSKESGYTKVEPVRTTAGVGNTTVGVGALGTSEDSLLIGDFEDITVLGTGLTDQSVAFQFAQRAPSGTATQLMSGSATFVVTSA